MDDMARIPPPHCTKVFIQRDYSEGTAVRFQTKFPQELDGKVSFCQRKIKKDPKIDWKSTRVLGVDWMAIGYAVTILQ